MSEPEHGSPQDSGPEGPGDDSLAGDAPGFEKGDKVWVHTEDGANRPAVYVGKGENANFFGGPPLAYVVMEETGQGGEVEIDRITARD